MAEPTSLCERWHENYRLCCYVYTPTKHLYLSCDRAGLADGYVSPVTSRERGFWMNLQAEFGLGSCRTTSTIKTVLCSEPRSVGMDVCDTRQYTHDQ